jgi:hypothetical protein
VVEVNVVISHRKGAIMAPKTLLAWHCELIAQNTMVFGRHRTVRPPTANEIEALVALVAQENRRWA